MTNTNVINGLKEIVADTYLMMLKTHNYHWNVVGIHFQPLHDFFEEDYKDMFDAVDELAERIRALGEKVPATTQNYQSLSSIEEKEGSSMSATDMLADLRDTHQMMANKCLSIGEIADQAGDAPTQDILNDRVLYHHKRVRMITALLADT